MKNLSSYKINVIENTLQYLSLLNKNRFEYKFVKKGNTPHGLLLCLGPSCYALKINYMLKATDNFSATKLSEWETYINSFQKTINNFPENSFIDDAYINYYQNLGLSKSIKLNIKTFLGELNIRPKYSKKQYIQKSIKAETKQAISTLYEIGYKNNKPYLNFPNDEESIDEFINMQDWTRPWDAGAQFSNLCVFVSTQDVLGKMELINKLNLKISNLTNPENGCYYKGNVTSYSEMINGSMKVLSGLNWLNIPIHYPEKLIDFSLNLKPSSEGCDLVDAVYVLHQCSKYTNYKKKEINNYFIEILNLIMLHEKKDGGFSYFLSKSQTHYYGVNVTKGLDESDLHGTTLLVWAISMIFDFFEDGTTDFKILKP